MIYIHQHTCISPQQSFGDIDLQTIHTSTNNQLKCIEPSYAGIPPGILRRMGKAVRMGIGAAMPLLMNQPPVDGFIIGTANGGMEDCIKFLNQIIDYEEGLLTPGNFVQSTPNAIAGQLGLMTKNQSYNITHVHRGLSFEMALLDAWMQVKENPGKEYLVGAVDEISDYNFNIDLLGGWYKPEAIDNKNLYQQQTSGSIAGEGAAMFRVSDQKEGSIAGVKKIATLHSESLEEQRAFIQQFIQENGRPDIMISGENGDLRFLPFYQQAESIINAETVVRYKHLTGEYPTSVSFALWLSCYIFTGNPLPGHAINTNEVKHKSSSVLIYNSYKGAQHSLISVEK